MSRAYDDPLQFCRSKGAEPGWVELFMFNPPDSPPACESVLERESWNSHHTPLNMFFVTLCSIYGYKTSVNTKKISEIQFSLIDKYATYTHKLW